MFPTATLDWLTNAIGKGRHGPHVEFVLMTPQIAKALLANNEDNRPIRPRVAAIANDIREGRWVFNGEPIIISTNGQVNDGQHRLKAVVDADRPALMAVSFGFARETRLSVDQGCVRGAGDYLQMANIPNAVLLASITRFILSYEAGDGTQLQAHHSTSKIEISERAMADAGLARSATFSATHSHHLKSLCTPTVIGAAHYLFTKMCEQDGDDFLRQVIIGEDIRHGDPAFAVRKAFIALRRKSQPAMMEILMRGWNAYRRNDKLVIAKVFGQFPSIS